MEQEGRNLQLKVTRIIESNDSVKSRAGSTFTVVLHHAWLCCFLENVEIAVPIFVGFT